MLRNLKKLFIYKSHYKYCLTSPIKLHTNSNPLPNEDVVQPADTKHMHGTNTIFHKYIKDEEKILNIVNNYNLSELLCYNISKGRANKLLAWRMSNGLLKNLSDICAIEGFGIKVADKFYHSLLQGPKIPAVGLGKTGKARTAPFITPSLQVGQLQRIKSCVSIKIGVNSITWARLEVPGQQINAPSELTHWEHHEISEKKLHINELIRRCLYVNHLIPAADCYLFENPQMAQASNNPGSVEQQNVNIQKAQVIAVMSYALAARNQYIKGMLENEEDKGTEYASNVFYLRRFLSARLFNHLVGTERISTEETVLNLMRTYYNTGETHDEELDLENEVPDLDDAKNLPSNDLNLSGRVQFPNELRQTYSISPRYHREYLGQALLLNLAFVRLVLLQDADSIALVTRGNKNKNVLNEEL